MNKLTNLMVFSILILVSLALPVLAHTGEDDYGHHGMMGGMMSGAYGFGGMWLFGWAFAILVLVALVLLIVWLLKQIQKK